MTRSACSSPVGEDAVELAASFIHQESLACLVGVLHGSRVRGNGAALQSSDLDLLVVNDCSGARVIVRQYQEVTVECTVIPRRTVEAQFQVDNRYAGATVPLFALREGVFVCGDETLFRRWSSIATQIVERGPQPSVGRKGSYTGAEQCPLYESFR